MFDLRTIHRLNDEFIARDQLRRDKENIRIYGTPLIGRLTSSAPNLEAEIDAQDPEQAVS